MSLIRLLGWIVFFTILSWPLIAWAIAVYSGRWLYLLLTAGTGAVIGANGIIKEHRYHDKHGKEQTGVLTRGWTYRRVVLPFGYQLDEDGRIEEFDETFSFSSFLRYFGIYWIGPPPFQRVTYEYTWTEFGDDGQPINRREPTEFFYVARAEYAIVLKDVEIGGNVRVDLPFSVFMRITTPKLFFVRNVEVVKQLNTILMAVATAFFRDIPYEQIKSEENDRLFSEAIMMLDIESTRGFAIDEVRLNEIGGKLSGNIQAAAEAKYVAEKEGDANIATAERANRVTHINADAQRYRLDTEFGAVEGNPDRMALRKAELMVQAGQAGNTIIFDTDSLRPDEKRIIVANQLPRRGAK